MGGPLVGGIFCGRDLLWEGSLAAMLYLILWAFAPQGETTAFPLRMTSLNNSRLSLFRFAQSPVFLNGYL